METELVLEIPSDVRTIEHVVEYVMERCSACRDQARSRQLNFKVGLTEALSNAILYGNADDPEKRVRVEVTVGRDSITAQVTDQGEGFDPSRVPDPTAPANLEKAGGRGLFLMRELLDEVHYNERGNSVTLVLRLEDGEDEEDREAARLAKAADGEGSGGGSTGAGGGEEKRLPEGAVDLTPPDEGEDGGRGDRGGR